MKRMTFAIVTALILGAITLGLPKLKSDVKANPVAKPEAASINDGACKDVKFRFKNSRRNNEIIEGKRIEYQVSGINGYLIELGGFTDMIKGQCPNGSVCTINSNNLARADGRNVTKIRLVYRYKGPGATDNRSDVCTSRELTPESPYCSTGKSYPSTSDHFTILSPGQ
jgi:hypothetical protein